MSTVKELYFTQGRLTKCEHIVNFCHALEKLSLNSVNLSFEGSIRQHFPSMRNLILINVPDYVEKGFLHANRNNIQILKLRTSIRGRLPNHNLIKALQLPQLTDLVLLLDVGNVSETYLHKVIAKVVRCSALRTLKLKLDELIFTNNFYKTVSSFQALKEMCIVFRCPLPNLTTKFVIIHLFRTDTIHVKYHNFEPYHYAHHAHP